MQDYLLQLEKEKLEEMKAIVTTITGYMVLPLYLVFWITDLVYAPQYKWEFLFLRCLVIPIAIIAQKLVNQSRTLEYAQNISLGYVIALAAIINVMILIMAEPLSPYYTGLILIAIGGLGFFPWTKKYFIYVVLGIFVPYYAIIISLGLNKQDLTELVVVSFAINGTVTVLWVINFYRDKLRMKEITARLELNSEIEKRKSIERDLIVARDDALKASKAKSAFLANMSHELRTPLNAIIGYSELLQEFSTDNDENYLKDLKKIDSAGQHLLKLINGVLDISKIEAGQMEVLAEKFDLASVISDVELTLRPILEKNKNKFILECPENIGEMKSDEIKLRQILYNLLSNAGKFTEDGVINLSVTALAIAEQPWLRFDVSDNGIGMTPAQLKKVFNAFTQADSSTTKKYGGSGLGLSICWHFCKMLGGDIFLKSRIGKGSVFTVIVPRNLDDTFKKVSSRELEQIVLQDGKL